MKRNDGINRRLPLGTYAFGLDNSERWHVVMLGGGYAAVWIGTRYIKFCETFAEAIADAQVFAREDD